MIRAANHAIQYVGKDVDAGIQELLLGALPSEETNLDWLESQLDQIENVGIGIYWWSKLIRVDLKVDLD